MFGIQKSTALDDIAEVHKRLYLIAPDILRWSTNNHHDIVILMIYNF